MIDIVIGSRNEGKIEEIKAVLEIPFINWLTYHDFKEWPQLLETADNYQDNAIHKAKTLSSFFKIAALADDSGLEVDTLDGCPGPLSARFAGTVASDEENIEKLLKELNSVPRAQRTARFRCWMALADIKGMVLLSQGVCEGRIAMQPKGSYGFGYDPIFIPQGYNLTFAEIPTDEKNRISHRGKALRKMRGLLIKYLKSS